MPGWSSTAVSFYVQSCSKKARLVIYRCIILFTKLVEQGQVDKADCVQVEPEQKSTENM